MSFIHLLSDHLCSRITYNAVLSLAKIKLHEFYHINFTAVSLNITRNGKYR